MDINEIKRNLENYKTEIEDLWRSLWLWKKTERNKEIRRTNYKRRFLGW